MSKRILEVKDLKISFDTYAGEVQAVRGVSFYVNQGETLGVVGESGCGKSVTMQMLMKLLAMPPARIKSGSIHYKGEEITGFDEKAMQRLRGKEMAMIFQDPMTSLNPTTKIGKQIAEGIRQHERIHKKEAWSRVEEMMRLVGIPNPEINMMRYPHTYSGGMRQRIMIAIAMACQPELVFADEPTTALDVTMEAQILELMQDVQRRTGTSIVLVTHDLGVIARMAQRIAVMYAGKIVECGTAQEIFYESRHPYTWGLMATVPDVSSKRGDTLYSIPGTPPDMIAPPKGCGFASRCRYCMDICRNLPPQETTLGETHQVSCWLMDERAPKVEPVRAKRREYISVNVASDAGKKPKVVVRKSGAGTFDDGVTVIVEPSKKGDCADE